MADSSDAPANPQTGITLPPVVPLPYKPTPSGPPMNGAHDVWTHRLVVIFLGLAVVFTGLNITILQALNKEPAAALANLGSVAIGALAMCLAHIMRPR